MIEELNFSEFEKVRNIFLDNNQQLPVFSIINGNHPGRIFVDNKNKPNAAIVWAIGRWAYIDGLTNNLEFIQSLPNLINESIIPDSKEKLKMDWFELYACGSPKWESIIDNIVKQFDSSKHFESVYVWNKKKYSEFRAGYKFPDDISIKNQDVYLADEKALKSSLVTQKFKKKKTFGFAAISKEQEELSLARSTGFEIGNRFMVDIITHDTNVRNKGYATAASVALLDYSLENNLVPLWETTEDNIGSQRLAKKLGFEKDQTYPVFVFEF